ncbi:hypothetical protein EYF80_023465 [Liparis tanakae]|uniref:Transmembrane protein n=1 Tax=Liparis tanakae TaxID=230148 RepID=A0A4Z2HKC7_9TELE|nr:hypothetical protein EYF80_023465 [Liparis tanakae]
MYSGVKANLSSGGVLLQPVVYLGHHGGVRRLRCAAGQKQTELRPLPDLRRKVMGARGKRSEVRNVGPTFRDEPRGLTHLKGLPSSSMVSSTFCLFSAASALLLSISSFIFLFSS